MADQDDTRVDNDTLLVPMSTLEEASLDQLRKLFLVVEALIHTRESTTRLKLRFDNEERSVGCRTEAGGYLTRNAIQAGFDLAAQQDIHIDFVGLRSPTGDEFPFIVTEEFPVLHLPSWAEKLDPKVVYEVLYEDDRDSLVEQLTEEERIALLEEFDRIDSARTGIISMLDVRDYFAGIRDAELAQLTSVHTGATASLHTKSLEESEAELEEAMHRSIRDTMEMDIDGDGTIELHEWYRGRAEVTILARKGKSSQKLEVKKPRRRPQNCGNCGKFVAAAFCTACGTPRRTRKKGSRRRGSRRRSPRQKQ